MMLDDDDDDKQISDHSQSCEDEMSHNNPHESSALTPVKKEINTPTKALEKHDLVLSMATISVSPMKLKSLPTGCKVKYAKRKVGEIKCRIKSKIARVLRFPEKNLESDSSDSSAESIL